MVGFLFFNRPGFNARVTGMQLVVHTSTTADSPSSLVHIPSGSKTLRLHRHADVSPRSLPSHWYAAPRGQAVELQGEDLCELLERFIAARGGAPPGAAFWALSGEDPSRWTSATQSAWLQQVLSHLGAQPPAGFKWTGHSLRKGAASAAAAVGVPLHVIAFYGTWSLDSATLAKDYIDPSASLPARLVLFWASHPWHPRGGCHIDWGRAQRA